MFVFRVYVCVSDNLLKTNLNTRSPLFGAAQTLWQGRRQIFSLGWLRCGITLNYDQSINQYDQFELIRTDAIIIFSQLCFAF